MTAREIYEQNLVSGGLDPKAIYDMPQEIAPKYEDFINSYHNPTVNNTVNTPDTTQTDNNSVYDFAPDEIKMLNALQKQGKDGIDMVSKYIYDKISPSNQYNQALKSAQEERKRIADALNIAMKTGNIAKLQDYLSTNGVNNDTTKVFDNLTKTVTKSANNSSINWNNLTADDILNLDDATINSLAGQ